MLISPLSVRPQVPSLSRLWPTEVIGSPHSSCPLLAMMVFLTVTVVPLLLLMPLLLLKAIVLLLIVAVPRLPFENPLPPAHHWTR